MTPPTIPEGLDLITTRDGVAIRRVWLNWTVAPLALFAVVWDCFLFFWYSTALSAPHRMWITIVFPLGHVAVGIGLTYFVIASLVNKTDVLVSPSGVRVAIGPFPWIGNRDIKLEQMTGVVVRQRAANRGATTYSVMYVDSARREKSLLKSLAQADQAEFIAETIRTALQLNA